MKINLPEIIYCTLEENETETIKKCIAVLKGLEETLDSYGCDEFQNEYVEIVDLSNIIGCEDTLKRLLSINQMY